MDVPYGIAEVLLAIAGGHGDWLLGIVSLALLSVTRPHYDIRTSAAAEA